MMNDTVARITLTAVLFVVLLSSPAISGSQTVYLQPEEGGFTWQNPYYEAVIERLLAHQYRKCQAVFLPSFSQESAVYLVWDKKNSMESPVVVSVKLEKQLWYEMQRAMEANADANRKWSVDAKAQQKALSQIQSVVNRLEAPLDKTVADALEQTWDAMLKRVHYPEEARLGKDGVTYHFANFVIGFGYRTGKVWSPVEGTPSYELVELAKTLREYPALREAKRKGAAQEMLKRAQKLLALLGDNSGR